MQKNRFWFLKKKWFVFLLLDIITGLAAFYGAYYLRFEGQIPALSYIGFRQLWYWYLGCKLLVFYFGGIYERIWRFARVEDLLGLIGSWVIASFSLVSISYFLSIAVPRSIFILTGLLDVCLSGGIRVIPKFYKEHGFSFYYPADARRVLIIGAGDAGVLVVKELLRQENPERYPLGFLDDDPVKVKTKIMGFAVLGTCADLAEVVREYKVDEVLIAMPTAPGEVIKEIAEICRKIKVPVHTLPRIYDLLNGEITVDLIREIKVEDLLGRAPVQLDIEVLQDFFQAKKIVVTGAGGSIGSELCRQLCPLKPRELILLGHDENPLFEIKWELAAKFPGIIITPIIADIKDLVRIRAVFQEKKPAIVFHAAAHKHVPLMEANPGEAFKNNVWGTKNVCAAAREAGVESFVFISTDKAVNPVSVMGATKRIAEIIIQDYNAVGTTKFAAVRFGNVLGSRGSVIPIFQEQIRRGGPITVTDPQMERFFMTPTEAAQLVLQAAGMAHGGEIFILDMGEAVKIVDLAKDLIRLSGLEPEEDIKIEFTGIRPGEKMFEEILTKAEGVTATKHQRIFVAQKQQFCRQKMQQFYEHWMQACPPTRETIFNLLGELEKSRISTMEEADVS